MASATGSVWNLNNWHWEEKSYSKWACDDLTQRFKNATLPDDIQLHDVLVTGDASVSVRKGKQVVAVEMTVNANWRCGDSTGTLKISEVDADSCEDGDFELRVESNEETEQARISTDKIRKGGAAALVRTFFKEFIQHLAQTANDRAAAEMDAQRRAAEVAKMKEAREVTGAAQQSLLTDVKAKDDQKWTEATSAPAPTAKPSATIPAQGSVWNVHSYHWEEKTLTKFAVLRLEALFGSAVPAFTLEIEDGDRPAYPCQVSLLNATVTGEASVSVRKGKKVLIFDLTIRCDWTAEVRDAKTKTFLCNANGGVAITEFNSENSSDEYEIDITGNPDQPARQRLHDVMVKEGKRQILKLLERFLKELENEG